MVEKTSFPLRLDAKTMQRVRALQKRMLPAGFPEKSVGLGMLPTISLAELMRWVVSLGLAQAEEIARGGAAAKRRKRGTK